MRVNTVQPPVPVRAGQNAPWRARAFTLLELMIVLVLLLAVAALVVPSVTSWFGTFHNDQIRAQVVAYAEDQLLESMRSGRPRVLWISGKAQQERAVEAASSPASERSAATTTPRAARWSLGCRVLSDIEPDSSEAGASASALTASGTSSDVATPTALAPAGVELPAGWGLSVAPASKRLATDSGEEPPGQPDLSSVEGRADEMTQTDQPVDAIVFWPTGQMDVLHQLEITEPDGKRWALDINTWTPSIRWTLAFDPADEAAARSEDSGAADESREPRDPDPAATDATRANPAGDGAGNAAGSSSGSDASSGAKPRAKPGENSNADPNADAKPDASEASTPPPARKRRAPGTAIPRDAKDKSADDTKEQGGGGKQ